MADQIYADGPIDAPAKYVVPGSTVIVPIAVQAVLDGSGASGDFVPALIFRSQAGHVISRVPTSQVVTAGGSAEVTWAPFLRSGGGVPTVTIFLAETYLTIHAPGTLQPQQVIPSGVVTPLAWQGVFHAGGGAPGGTVTPNPGDTAIVWQEAGDNTTTLSVVWPAGAYDRYIELTVAHPSTIGTVVSPRLRTSLTPAGDDMTIAATISGGVGPPATTLTANVFQSSGVNQSISAEMYMVGDQPEVVLS